MLELKRASGPCRRPALHFPAHEGDSDLYQHHRAPHARGQMRFARVFSVALVATSICLATDAPARAQAYPVRPIRIIVPTPAGGPVDVIARLLANYLSSTLGQPAVIDNRPGAGNTLGSKEAA